MEFIFTYGTLQDKRIQLALFKRTLTGCADSLLGYALAENKMAGLYPVIYPTKENAVYLEGIVYEVNQDELDKADDYEGEEYQRMQVVLESGIRAWVYVGK